VANGGGCVAVYQTGIPQATGHADQDPGELLGIVQGLGVRSIIAIPLVVAGQRRGVVQMSSSRAEHFTARDLDFLLAVAGWVGMVVQRAELSEQITAQAAE
jgi:GAF domain-containing protein